jgi:hypothetical protein
MFDLRSVPEPLCVSVMREGQTVCVSVYSNLPDGKSGEAFYGLILDMAMQQAAELAVGLVIDGGHDEER